MLIEKRKLRSIALFFGAIGCLLAGCAHLEQKETSDPPDLLMEGSEKKLATLDPALSLPRSLFFSPDGRHAVWVNRAGEQVQVVVDGVAGPPFDSIGRGPVTLSPDGRRVAYVVENKTNQHLSVVVDGKAGPEYEKILSGTPLFSPDGRHVAYAAVREGKYYVILDAAVGPDYELVGHLTFSPDGGRFAYAAQKDKKRFIVADGVPGAPFEDVFIAGFSPDGRHLVYYATEEKQRRVIIDDQPGPLFEAVGPVQFYPAAGKGASFLSYVGLRGSELIQLTQPLR
ncbi:MAG: PD40 domain-containing protein [Nitrospirae bacterium]|nr:PD40 domain-containing protein [Candidatus Manganitrophaceae bacterium]